MRIGFKGLFKRFVTIVSYYQGKDKFMPFEKKHGETNENADNQGQSNSQIDHMRMLAEQRDTEQQHHPNGTNRANERRQIFGLNFVKDMKAESEPAALDIKDPTAVANTSTQTSNSVSGGTQTDTDYSTD
jgi:hypothetical protein